MSQHLVNQYLNDLDRYNKMSGSLTEGVISEAFKDLLKAWARQANLHFINQYEFVSTQKTRIRPDGTILHDLRVPLGYWEAKDSGDDLDAEIDKKKARGYPQDNIIYEDSVTAVLIQNRQEVTRCPMIETGRLLHLLTLFFGYERQEIAEFRKAVAQFKADLPAVLDALRGKIDQAYTSNPEFLEAARKFLAHARDTINPAVSEADVREMLIQHILTEEIFAHVFNDSSFHRENNIARELYALEEQFFTGATKRNTLKALETYYAAIRANAAVITSHHEKQGFLKAIYENFYKVYNPKAADRLGVVYTPNEIVKFMIEGADWLCEKHFGKTLIDRDVEILDPATGTGTFICELLEHFRGQPQKLAHKYKNELHANEVAILPYYVANLNIEATYAAISGQFAEFPNLCFVDTLDNVAGLGIRAGHQHDLFGAMSEENVERVKRQNKRKISVIIGNPPYNAWQDNYNSRNPNRPYKRIDERIAATYIKRGTAQNKNSVYDMYTRFIRWASDRLHDDGVIAFITNRNLIEKVAFDGFRRATADEFAEIWLMDLGGDVRANPKISGTKHNVFGIQTGVTVSFLVKRHKHQGCRIFYARRPEMETAEEKLSFLGGHRLSALAMEEVQPDKGANWLNQTSNDFDSFIPLADPANKGDGSKSRDRSLFKLFSNGLKSQRDEWVYDFSREALEAKVRLLVETYEATRKAPGNPDRDSIKWDAELDRYAASGIAKKFEAKQLVQAAFRPFNTRWLYFDRHFNGRTYQLPSMFPPGCPNHAISFSGLGYRADFCVMTTDHVFDLHFGAAADGYQGVSRYRYAEDGARVDNITDWGLKQFQARYESTSPLAGEVDARSAAGEGAGGGVRGANPSPAAPLREAPTSPARGEVKSSKHAPARGEVSKSKQAKITKDDIFHYVYAVLHDPVYRETYAINLKREFPRIPFYPDFRQWAAWGKRLMELHIGYETVEPWPLERRDLGGAEGDPVPKLKADRTSNTIVLDSRTTLSGIPASAWDYRLGNRSGLEWVLDQYKEKKPKDPTIREKFNTYRFKDHKEKVIDLLARVTRVSVETMAIVEAMRKARRE